jgi:hypothetical protein
VLRRGQEEKEKERRRTALEGVAGVEGVVLYLELGHLLRRAEE